jgi:predicted dehydrogenase
LKEDGGRKKDPFVDPHPTHTHTHSLTLTLTRTETAWRKTPEYQGGFLLDGGIHYIAGLRALLGRDPANRIASLSARTTQLQPHLPPIDTVDAVLQTAQGATGSFSVSFGTMFDEMTWQAAFEHGSVVVGMGEVRVVRGRGEGAEVLVREFGRGGEDVKAEVRAWAEGIARGRLDGRQTPEEALEDLVLLEAMFRSGEEGGKAVVF